MSAEQIIALIESLLGGAKAQENHGPTSTIDKLHLQGQIEALSFLLFRIKLSQDKQS